MKRHSRRPIPVSLMASRAHNLLILIFSILCGILFLYYLSLVNQSQFQGVVISREDKVSAELSQDINLTNSKIAGMESQKYIKKKTEDMVDVDQKMIYEVPAQGPVYTTQVEEDTSSFLK